MHKHLLNFTLAATLLLQLPGLASLELNASSRVSQAIAYRGQAMVTREASLGSLKAGDYHVAITGIPMNLNKDSLQVSGLGSAAVTVQHLEVAPTPADQEDPYLKQLVREIEQLEQKILALDNQAAVTQLSQQFVNNVNTISQEKIQKQLSYYQIRIEHWQELLTFLSKNQASILENQRSINFLKKQLQEKIQELRVQIQKHQQDSRVKPQVAHVFFTVKRPGTLTLQLSYLIQGVNWQPSYDARLSEKEQKLHLTYLGNVLQNTGENWDQIRLSLSTATPMLNARVPQLSTWQVSLYSPPPAPPMAKTAAKPSAGPMDEASAGYGDDNRKADLDYAQSEIQQQGISVLFQLPQPISIESASHERRVPVNTMSFPYSAEYHVVPKLSPLAYLRIKAKNIFKVPLLAGPMRNYMNQDYTGTSTLPLIRPNEEMELDFGVDTDIKVERKQLKSEVQDDKTPLSNIRRHLMAFEVEISNFKEQPQTIQVFDQIPVSNDEKIKIKTLAIKPRHTKELKDGGLQWTLEFKPWEKKTIYLEYVIEYPKDAQLYF